MRVNKGNLNRTVQYSSETIFWWVVVLLLPLLAWLIGVSFALRNWSFLCVDVVAIPLLVDLDHFRYRGKSFLPAMVAVPATIASTVLLLRHGFGATMNF